MINSHTGRAPCQRPAEVYADARGPGRRSRHTVGLADARAIVGAEGVPTDLPTPVPTPRPTIDFPTPASSQYPIKISVWLTPVPSLRAI